MLHTLYAIYTLIAEAKVSGVHRATRLISAFFEQEMQCEARTFGSACARQSAFASEYECDECFYIINYCLMQR